MTARQVFEATLIELSKVQAPSLKLYEFNYLFNKAINQYINKVYNVYDINQQTTDDLRVLKATVYLTPNKVGYTTNNPGIGVSESALHNTDNAQASSYLSQAHSSIQSLNGATYEVFMPQDYLHILNCVCIYYVAKQRYCWNAGSYIQVPATRLTADSWSQILTDIYNRPSPIKPYYYINNVNQQSSTLPTNPAYVTDAGGKRSFRNGTDMETTYEVTSNPNVPSTNAATTEPNGTKKEVSNFERIFTLNNTQHSIVEKPIASRVGNPSTVRCEIRYGQDDSLFQLKEVAIDYVKVPQFIRLTQEQIDLTEDTSQIMEFPDYVNQEIINELVHLVMERTADPRLQTNLQISQSIARPTQQQATPNA